MTQAQPTEPLVCNVSTILDILWKEALNSDGQQFHQYQQSKHSPLTEYKKHHSIWHRTSRHMAKLNRLMLYRFWFPRYRVSPRFWSSFVMKRKYKQWWSTIQPISRKQTFTSHLYSQNTKNTTYDVGNQGPGLGQAQTCGRVKPFNAIPTIPLFFMIFNLMTKGYFYIKSETFPLTVIWASLRITTVIPDRFILISRHLL